jgi:rubrerythrin
VLKNDFFEHPFNETGDKGMPPSNIPANNSNSFEDIKELFREVARQSQETDKKLLEVSRQIQETEKMFLEVARQSKETDKKILEVSRQIQETDKMFLEIRRQSQETDKRFRQTDKKISELGDRIGEFVEAMVEGNIVSKFKKLNYSFNGYAPHFEFFNDDLGIFGEIDFLLVGNELELLVEVKTKLSISDVKDHLKRLEKYRRYQTALGKKNKLLAAVAGGVVSKEVRAYVLKQGLFLLIQSGESFQIFEPPKGPADFSN